MKKTGLRSKIKVYKSKQMLQSAGIWCIMNALSDSVEEAYGSPGFDFATVGTPGSDRKKLLTDEVF